MNHGWQSQASHRIVIKKGSGGDEIEWLGGEPGLNQGYDANQNNFVFIRPATTPSHECAGANFSSIFRRGLSRPSPGSMGWMPWPAATRCGAIWRRWCLCSWRTPLVPMMSATGCGASARPSRGLGSRRRHAIRWPMPTRGAPPISCRGCSGASWHSCAAASRDSARHAQGGPTAWTGRNIAGAVEAAGAAETDGEERVARRAREPWGGD